jgi:hypothetical protein
MPENVRVENVVGRALAAARTTTSPERLSTDIRKLLDQVWPVLRAQNVRTGHNVVVYYPREPGRPGRDGAFTIEAGSRRSANSRRQARCS